MSVSFSEIRALLSPDGQQQLIAFIQQAKEQRGAGWLEEIKIEFPMFCWIAELVSNRSSDEAFSELQRQFPLFPLLLVKPQIHQLHSTIKTEIDKPRG